MHVPKKWAKNRVPNFVSFLIQKKWKTKPFFFPHTHAVHTHLSMTLTHAHTNIQSAHTGWNLWSLCSLYMGVPLLAAPAVDFMHFFLCEKDGPGCDFDWKKKKKKLFSQTPTPLLGPCKVFTEAFYVVHEMSTIVFRGQICFGIMYYLSYRYKHLLYSRKSRPTEL